MKRFGRKMLVSVVFLALGLLFFLLSLGELKKLDGGLSDCACLYSGDGAGMTFGELAELKQESGMDKLYAFALGRTERGSVAAQDVYYTYATPMDGAFTLFEMTDGGSWTDWTDEEAPTAFLPASLAVRLFSTETPEGVTVTLGGTEYAVGGVYREDGSFLARATAPDRPQVYVIDPAQAEQEIVELFVNDSLGRDASYLQRWISGRAAVPLRGDVSDFRLHRKLVGNLFYVQVLFYMLLAAALLLTVGGGCIVRAREEKEKRLPRILAGAAIIAAALFGLSRALTLVSIPSAYLPAETIFDFRFYSEAFTGWLRRINAKALYGGPDRLFAARALLSLALELTGIICFAVGTVLLFLRLRAEVRGRRTATLDGMRTRTTARWKSIITIPKQSDGL